MKLGILLVNQKMKLKLEVRYLEKTLDESNKSLFDKIKSMFKKNSYSKLKKELKVKKDYLEFIDKYMKENKEKLMYYPAAQKNHHAEYGGLLYHMKRMLMNGERMCQVYRNLNPDWVKAGVIVHDIEKINEIQSDEMGVSPGYSFEGNMLGHIVQGIKLIEKMAEEIGMSHEKTVMLEHMILSHHYEPEYGSPKRPMFPEAEILHYLDMIDARMFDMEDALVGVEPGEFSERIWILDNRRLYKPSGQ